MDYPTPDQLQAYAMEPMPFEPLHECEEDINDDMTRRFTRNLGEPTHPAFPGEAEVVFKFVPSHINVEQSDGEYERVENLAYDLTHEEVMDRAENREINDDFICETALIKNDERHRLTEAYWILDEVTFKSPAIVR